MLILGLLVNVSHLLLLWLYKLSNDYQASREKVGITSI